MSYADGLKDSEIASAISNSSYDEDTSESESIKEKNTSRRKKALSRKKTSVINRRAPAELVSKTGSCKTRKTKETQQDEGEIEENRIIQILKKTSNQHQQPKTISCHFESQENNSESTKSDDRKLNVTKKDSLGKTLPETKSSDNEDSFKDFNRKDNIISRLFKNKITKSKTRRSSKEHSKPIRGNSSPKSLSDEVENEVIPHIPQKVNREECIYDQSESSASGCAMGNFLEKNKAFFKDRGSQSIGEPSGGKNSSITVQNILSGYSEKVNNNVNGLNSNSTCEQNQTKNYTRTERSLKKEFLHDGSRSADHRNVVKDNPKKQSSCMFKKVHVSKKIREYISQSTHSNSRKSNQLSYRISPDLKKSSISKNLANTRFLSSSSLSDSESDSLQKPLIKTSSNTKISSRKQDDAVNSSTSFNYRHLNKQEVSNNQSHTRFLSSSPSSSDSENGSAQKPPTKTNCNNNSKNETKSYKRMEANCHKALSDLFNGKSGEKSPVSDISSSKNQLPFSNCVEEKYKSSRNKRVTRELPHIFPKKSSLINNFIRKDVAICESSVTLTSQDTHFAYSSPDNESSESHEGRDMLFFSDSSDNVVENEKDTFPQNSYLNIENDNPNKIVVENKNLGKYKLHKCLPNVDLDIISPFSNNSTKTEVLLSDCKNVSTVYDKINLSSRSSESTNINDENRTDVCKTPQHTYFHYSSSNEDDMSSTEIKKSKYLYSTQNSSDDETGFGKKFEASSSVFNIINSKETEIFSSRSNSLPGRSTRKRKPQYEESEATPSKVSWETLRSTSDTETRTFFSSKKVVGNEDNLSDDLYSLSNIHSPTKNSAKKNLFSHEKKMSEVSVHLTDCRTPTKQKNNDQNDKENRAQSLSKCKNESTPQKVTSKEHLSCEKDAETEGQVKYKLTPLKPAQTPTKQINLGSSSPCEKGSRTPRKNRADNMHKEECQTSNKLSPQENNFDEVSPSKNVTGSASKLKSYEQSDEEVSKTKTPLIRLKNSITERELKRLSIDCDPRCFETPSPVRKRRPSALKATTPQKLKDSDESTVKTPQKGSTKKDIEKINYDCQVKRFTPCKNENKLSNSNETPPSPAEKSEKYKRNDRENRSQSLSKRKNESTPQKVTNKEYLICETDAETDCQVKYKLTPLKPAQIPTKQLNVGSSLCEKGSRTPKKKRGDNEHKEESQTSKELSPLENNFEEVSPSKNVTGSASKLKSYEESDEEGSKTRTPLIKLKNSITERELKRLSIDCKPTCFETHSPVRKRSFSVLKATTPQKHKDSDEITVKTPQKESAKRDVEKINEGRQIKRFTPCKNENKLISSSNRTPLSPAEKCEKYKQNVMSPLQRKDVTVTTPVSKKKSGRALIPASMAKKEHFNKGKTDDDLDTTRKLLHISTVPKSLPCRDAEFDQIKSFLLRKIEHSAGGCMYISGVPGTGKTATVHAVIRTLQQGADNGDLPEFDFVEVNGLRLTEPKQAYVRILQALTDRKLSPDQAQQLLNKRFSGECKKSTIILVDELDYLCNRRQDVVYNILDWPTKRGSGLVVLTISNTMDLPERTLKGRVTSRMGLTRVTFQPYSHHQLRAIVEDRLGGTDTFHPDAVQLVARKVAAVSGDARRALDICRRTTELVTRGEQVTVSHVERALTQIFSGPRVTVIQSLCREGQLVLRAIRDINQRTGVDEAIATQVYQHLMEICLVEGCPRPTVGAMLQTCVALVALGLIVAEKGRVDIMRKMSLNVSSDDIHYALDKVMV